MVRVHSLMTPPPYFWAPRANWRRGAQSPSGAWAAGLTARPAARLRASPPRSWRSRCCVASWQAPCGRRRGYPATACGPTLCAPIVGRHMRMRSTSCGTAQSGSGPGKRGALGYGTRRQPSHSLGRPASGRPACGGRASSPSGAGGGTGVPGRGPVLLVRHVPGGPRRPHGRRPRLLGGPQGLLVPRLAAAAPQPLPLGRLCRPPPGGCGPRPAAPSARGPAGVAMAPGLCLGFGPVGTGAGLDAGAGGGVVG